MEPNQIEQLLSEALGLEFVQVKAEGSHYNLIVVGECFEGLSPVKRQQAVYAPLMDKIADGSMHAVSIKAYTPSQWQRERKLMFLS